MLSNGTRLSLLSPVLLCVCVCVCVCLLCVCVCVCVSAVCVCVCVSKSTGSAAFTGLTWTCLLVRSVFSAPDKREGPVWKKTVRGKLSERQQVMSALVHYLFVFLRGAWFDVYTNWSSDDSVDWSCVLIGAPGRWRCRVCCWLRWWAGPKPQR